MIRNRYKAIISKGNPPKGIIKTVIGFKDNSGGRWEFVGALPRAAVYIIMAMCATNGERQCYAVGQDEGIENAFTKGRAA